MREKRGSSLTELVIALSVAGILTAMLLPKVDYTGFRLDAGVRGVRAALQRAQAMAINSQHNMLIAVDTTRGVLYVIEDVNNNLAVDPGERVTTMPLEDGVVFSTPPSTWPGAPVPAAAINGPALITIAVNGVPMPGFTFRSDGAASSDVQIYVTSPRGKLSDLRGVSVFQTTGRVDWYKTTAAGSWIPGGF
jgi:type II secretory pathway pseudopilin PulG